MLHWIFQKSKKKKGFSLIELLVVVGIMGLLAAIAIPAFNRYKVDTKVGVVSAVLTQIAKSFPACLSVKGFDDCSDDDIRGTLPTQAGTTITSETVAGDRTCYRVVLTDNTADGFEGCIDFENDNTGTRDNLVVGRPQGTDCADITMVNLSCSSTFVLGNDCPTDCTFTPGLPAPVCTSGQAFSAGGGNTAHTCGTGTTMMGQAVQCTTAGVCKLN